jgi:hypothetical protein
MSDFARPYFDELFRGMRGYKRLADVAIAQLSDEQFFAPLDADDNSVAIIVKHMAGSLHSRFTDFLTTDGEKPDRNRDQEFLLSSGTTRVELLDFWERGWGKLFDTINSLEPEDLVRTVTIREEPHSVLQALQRAMAHMASHAGQVIFLAKHWKGSDWKTLSVAKGQSEQHNIKMREKFKAQSR